MKKTFLLLIPILILLVGCVPAGNGNTPAVGYFDPNLEAVRAQQTSDARGAEAQILGAMATGTAQAPIIAITQRAADLIVEQTRVSMQSTQIASSWSPTPSPTETITMTPTPNLTATVAMDNYLFEKNEKDKAAENLALTNQFWAYARIIVFLLAVAAVIIGGLYFLRSHRRQPIKRDESGDIEPMLDVYTGRSVDLSSSPNYFDEDVPVLKQIIMQYLQRKYGFVPSMPQITAERQDKVKEREQIIKITRVSRRLPKALIDRQSMEFLTEPGDEQEQLMEDEAYPELPLPSWVELNKWDGNLLPVGNDENSNLMLVDTSLRPHLLYAGRSRSGKTLTGERTAVACLLTQGWNVIVMGKRVDWMPFTDHPNFKLLAVDVRKDAQKYIDILQILSAQMDIRDSILTSKGIGTWGLYGAPSTMVVLDDYSGALIRMPAAKAKEVVSEVRSIALDGAKFGLSITIGLQDATAQNIDTTTRSQMARIVFSMDNATKSRIALGSNADEGPGAEYLPPRGHFLARVSDDANIRRGVGFWLQNNEVEAFLASRPVQQNGEMEWVDGVIVGQPALTSQKTIHLPASTPVQSAQPISRADFVNGLSEWEEQVLDLYEAGLDQVHIVEKIFAGDNLAIGTAAVADLIKRWQVVKGVTPANSQPDPETAQVTAEQATQYADDQIDAQIRKLHAQMFSNTNIVYEIWDKSSAEFSKRMARVKRVLATASASEVPEMPQNEPLAA